MFEFCVVVGLIYISMALYSISEELVELNDKIPAE
jgi:cell division protein FtsL